MTRPPRREAPFISRPSASLAELFSEPPSAFTPVPIWWWSGARLDARRLRQQMEMLTAGGIRQAVVMNLAPNGPLYGALADEPEFFSDAWWTLFQGVCHDAEELGFSMWFYDQLGFSGADLQWRLVQRHPSYRGRALEQVSVDVDGTATIACPTGGEPLAAFALPLRGEPMRLQLRESAATWSGEGRLLLAYAVPSGFDYLAKDPCAALIDTVHGEFERRVGQHLGTTIVGSFQDELASLPSWSVGFADQFQRRRGYDLLGRITGLWHDGDPRVRADYQRTRAELAEEAFFRPLSQWHDERGLAVGFDQQHPARAGYPVEATQQYADYLRTHRWFSAPGSDHWGDAKVHSSLAHLYGHPRTWLEAFHTTGWGGTLEETFDWLLPWLRAGATLYDPHAVYYSTAGGQWEWAPPSTCWRQPYWRHYPLFARSVSRLCAALSWGDHVCDVAVLYPTSTVQREVPLDLPRELLGQSAGMFAAQDTYLDVVGQMHWYEPKPGVLDRDRRDFDVLDEDSVVRGTAADSVLRIGTEGYRAIVLPSCTDLEPATAQALRTFALSGGLLVAVGRAPEVLSDVVRLADTPQDLPAALADLPRRVISPLPTLLRSDGESAALFVVGAFPGATVQAPERAWQTEGYSFDASRYSREVAVTVRGLPDPVALWEPGTATAVPLSVARDGDLLHIDVPLTEGPCGLLVFGPAAAELLSPLGGAVVMAHVGRDCQTRVDLEDWTGELLPTLDNTWGDFAHPPSAGPLPFQIWHLEHQDPETGEWGTARATFGPRGEVRRAAGAWQSLVWSDRFGAPADGTEPRGFVPEQFLDLGDVAAGEMLDLRFCLEAHAASTAFLTVGSTADADICWNGEPVEPHRSVYYDHATVDVRVGDNLLEIRLAAATARRLRASWALRPARERLPRPEWVTGKVLSRELGLSAVPATAELQLGTVGRVTLRVNGEVVARHGEFDNYSQRRQPRARRYEVRGHLRAGRNDIVLELHEPEAAAAVDAFLDDVCVVTDGSWHGEPRGVAEVPHDPRWIQLRPREHPLPGVDAENAGQHVADVRAPGRVGPQTFRFTLPPGAIEFRLPAVGAVQVAAGDVLTDLVDGVHRLVAPAPAGTPVTVTVDGKDSGGGLFPGPVEVNVAGGGALPLGDWTQLGLRDWSGGVRYRCVVRGVVDAVALDLGAVRGTAEVRVNGRSAGCRIWAPYRFEISGLLDQDENVVEVDVYNTLAPYIAAMSTSPWVLPGQTVSGLLGPVALLVAEPTL